MHEEIVVRGARTHNLKNISIKIPRDKLVVITGLSGSGKSSLAFDTLYAEGQRRYVESLSTYARQFLSLMDKPDVDDIQGLSPAISIEQKATSHNPRSTVGTVTEIYDYLRLLFARIGTPHCPEHHEPLIAQTVPEIVEQILALPENDSLMLLAPIVSGKKGAHQKLFEHLQAQGFIRVRINGSIYSIDEIPELKKTIKYHIEVVVDRFKVKPDIRQRLNESIEVALKLGEGTLRVAPLNAEGNSQDIQFSANYACSQCGYTLTELEPRIFSFNNPAGACTSCDGLGVELQIDIHRVLFDELSIEKGAIRNWGSQSRFNYPLMQELSEQLGFSLKEPFCELDKGIKDLLMWGSAQAKRSSDFDGQLAQPFEGIIPNLTRRYHESQSESVRNDIASLMMKQTCHSCKGSRLQPSALHVLIHQQSISDLTRLNVADLHRWLDTLSLQGNKKEIASKIIKEITERLNFLVDVGLDYMELSRNADSLSGGEAQRIRLASQIGAGLVGVMYVLDEPSIGLHQRDNERLIKTLERLRDLGNTVIVVEHDEDMIRAADFIIDIGPRAGIHGGEVVAAGSLENIIATPASLTADFLTGKRSIEIPTQRRRIDENNLLELKGASGNNLKSVNLSIPLSLLTCITGVSGSGKSTLINDTLYQIAQKELNGSYNNQIAPYKSISGLDKLDKVINIDQSPIGRTPRSNPATYTGVFSLIRDLFAGVVEARTRGYKAGRFSFNVKGGRCETCQGDGVIKVEMHFLPDVYVNCDACKGKRYNTDTLEILYKGKSILDVLNMTIEEAEEFFNAVPAIQRRLETLNEVGLGYIRLGQSATTLSGGEAQRVKLAKELTKRDTGKTLYILDEPTTGLHFEDIRQLLLVIQRLKENGNTIVIIEHNLDVIKTADWVIDLGPEGGSKGGEIIAQGTPEAVAKNKKSITGQFLSPILAN